MKTREKLERAGWVWYAEMAGLIIFARGEMRIVYNPGDDGVYSHYSARELFFKKIEGYHLQVLCEK